jgi:hypothetical protein
MCPNSNARNKFCFLNFCFSSFLQYVARRRDLSGRWKFWSSKIKRQRREGRKKIEMGRSVERRHRRERRHGEGHSRPFKAIQGHSNQLTIRPGLFRAGFVFGRPSPQGTGFAAILRNPVERRHLYGKRVKNRNQMEDVTALMTTPSPVERVGSEGSQVFASVNV